MSNPTTTTCPIALLPGHPSQLTLLPGWRAVHGIRTGPCILLYSSFPSPAPIVTLVRLCYVEIIEELAGEAEARLRRLGYDNIGVHIGDGSLGWAEHAPYDKIIVTAAAKLVPPALLEQLKPGGRMVLPIALAEDQKLTVVEKDVAGRAAVREVMSVRFGLLETVR